MQAELNRRTVFASGRQALPGGAPAVAHPGDRKGPRAARLPGRPRVHRAAAAHPPCGAAERGCEDAAEGQALVLHG
eukprot:scaffold143405_cov37-Prasinocladus_malaysianus.AAC.1